MGTRQHLAFLHATRATCADELRRIQAVNNELHRWPKPGRSAASSASTYANSPEPAMTPSESSPKSSK
ncbi:hypothetical protein V9K99_20755 [Kribbella sp. CCNWLW201]